ITEFPLNTHNTGFDQISTSFDGNLWYVGRTGNVIGRIVDDTFNTTSLAAAVLPASRSVQVGSPAIASPRSSTRPATPFRDARSSTAWSISPRRSPTKRQPSPFGREEQSRIRPLHGRWRRAPRGD